MKKGFTGWLIVLLWCSSLGAFAYPVDKFEPYLNLEASLPEFHTSTIQAADTAQSELNWWQLLKKGKLNLYDPEIKYPKFIGFCVNVYRWGDRVFNTYDTTYVKPTGRRWKAMIRSNNWVDSYAINLDQNHVFMASNIVANIGPYITYMAVSVGYEFDLTNIFGKRPMNHKKFDFNFNCARFSIDAYFQENTGGTYLRRFNNYNDGHFFKYYLENLRLKAYGVDLYYYFNNRHYSQAAAYNFGRYQIKSSGSLITGLSLYSQDLSFDFTKLPNDMKQHFGLDNLSFYFHYNDYSLIVGYGYNWVFAKHCLFNICALPTIGYKHCFDDCVGGKRDIFSANIKGAMSVTYAKGDFFAGFVGKIDGHSFIGHNYSLFNSIESMVANVGFRF